MRGKALRQIDLITVTGTDVIEDMVESVAVTLGREIGGHRRCDTERCTLPFGRCRGKQLHQTVPFAIGIRITPLPDQPGTLFGVIDHHRPVINADGHIRNAFAVACASRQTLQTSREVITEITDRTSGEWQLTAAGRIYLQLITQQFEGIGAREFAGLTVDLGQTAARHQSHMRFSSDDVVTRLPRIVQPAVEKHRPRPISNRLKQCGTVRTVGQFSQQLDRHFGKLEHMRA